MKKAVTSKRLFLIVFFILLIILARIIKTYTNTSKKVIGIGPKANQYKFKPKNGDTELTIAEYFSKMGKTLKYVTVIIQFLKLRVKLNKF